MLRIAQHRRAQEHHQVGLGTRARVVREERAEQRQVAQQRHLFDAVLDRILDQAADHHDLPVIHQHHRFDGALVRNHAGGVGRVLDAGDFLVELQLDGTALRDLRLHPQRQADITPLDGLERARCRGSARKRVLPRDERHVLADDDPRFLVVEGQQRRRRQDVGVVVGFQRPHQHAEVEDLGADAGDRDHALDHADVEAASGRCGIRRDAQHVLAGAAEVRAAEGVRAGFVHAAQVLPLDAKFRGLVGADLRDQRLHINLRPSHVELVQRRAQVVVDRIGGVDEDRVGRRVGHDHAGRERNRLGSGQGRRQQRRRAGGRCRDRKGHGPGRRRGNALSQVDRAQRLRHLHRFGVLQVHDVQVARSAGRRVEHRDEGAQPRDARRVVSARNEAVRARVCHHAQALRGVGRGLRRIREQAVDEERDIERRRMPQRDHDRVGAARLVDRVDDPVDALQVAGVVRDHQGVARRINGDRVRGGDQRAQDRQQLRRRFVFEREYLGLDLVAGDARPLVRADSAARVEFGVGLRNDLDHAAFLDGGVALQSQRREEHLVHQRARHRSRRDDIDGALDVRIEHEVLAGDLAHRFHHALDVGVDEVEGDVIGVGGARGHASTLGGCRFGRPRRQGKSGRADPHDGNR